MNTGTVTDTVIITMDMDTITNMNIVTYMDMDTTHGMESEVHKFS
jgi:hypothetical protein